jgi:hypothetical protein
MNSKATTGFFSKLLHSFVGNPATTGDEDVVAESSSSSGGNLVKIGNVINHNDPAALPTVIQQHTEEIAVPQQKPSKRRRTLLIEEEKKWEEMQRSLENGVVEWKKSLDLGYEFDHLEVWPHDQGEEENQVTLPSNHLSTSAMYGLKNLKNIT